MMKWTKAVLVGTAMMLALPNMVMAEEAVQEELLNGVNVGVMVFDPEDPQTKAFREYLERYLGEAFDATFYYSDAVIDVEGEKAFIEQMHELGVGGIIGNVSEESMELCEEYGIYYLRGASTVSDEEFDREKDNEHFLGTISASLEDEEEAGREMAEFFANDEGKDSHGFAICTGGNIEIHRLRSKAMIETLTDIYGFKLEKTPEELAEVTEITDIDTGTDIKLTLIPGFPAQTPIGENVQSVLEKGGYDTLMSVMMVHQVMDAVRISEEATGSDIRVGSVDCFTEEAQELFETEDQFGNPQLNYLAGKYGAMIAPSFAALCNAYAGNVDAVREDGHAFRLYQDYWIATDPEEFQEMFYKTISLYDNTYSAADIMGVIKAFTPEMTFEDFKEFTENNSMEED